MAKIKSKRINEDIFDDFKKKKKKKHNNKSKKKKNKKIKCQYIEKEFKIDDNSYSFNRNSSFMNRVMDSLNIKADSKIKIAIKDETIASIITLGGDLLKMYLNKRPK